MTIADVPESVLQAFALFTALRDLGFQSDEIQIIACSDGMAVRLQAQDRDFVINCGELDGTPEETGAVVREATPLWQGLPEPEAQILYRKYIPRAVFFELAARLVAKGFRLPASLN